MIRGCLLVAVVALVSGCAFNKVETELPGYVYNTGAAKTEKANGIYWLYVLHGDGVRILLGSNSEFKIDYKGGRTVVSGEKVGGRTVVTSEKVGMSDVVVPDTLGGKRVVAFDCWELSRCCCAATSIFIPDGVTDVGVGTGNPFTDNPFYVFENLKKIVVSKNHPTYSVIDGILYDKSGKTLLCCPAGKEGNVVLPNGVEIIGRKSFAGCSRIKGLSIPPSVREIRDDAFTDFSLVSIDARKFSCSALEAIYIRDIAAWCRISFGEGDPYSISYSCRFLNPLYHAHKLYLNGEPVKDIVIPDEVKGVGGIAFVGCDSLRSVSLPNSVTNVGNFAFAHCGALEEVKFCDGIESIGDGAFSHCVSLRKVNIPKSVKYIGGCAFRKCASLEKIEIPDSVVSIGTATRLHEKDGGCVFEDCTALRRVVFPKTISRIPERMFSGCKSLEQFEMPDSVETIGRASFYGCKSLRKANIPNSVKIIEGAAFTDCKSLAFDTSTVPGCKMIDGWVVDVDSHSAKRTLDLSPARGVANYAIKEKNWIRHIVFPENMEVLEISSYWGYKNISELTFPPGIKQVIMRRIISLYPRMEWKLEKVNIGDISAWSCIDFDVDSIYPCPCCCPGYPGVPVGSSNPLGQGAALYKDGKKLTKIVIPGTTKRIGRGAFYGYGELESVVIEDGVEEIGAFAFYNCSNLVSVVRPDHVLIGRDAFGGCTSLKTDVYSQPYMLKMGW